MDSEYPPLPHPAAPEASVQALSLDDALLPTAADGHPTKQHPDRHEIPKTAPKIISSIGDVIVKYTDQHHRHDTATVPVSHCWQVSSEDLIQNSPYFRALLDPNKFAEGRHFTAQKRLAFTNHDRDTDHGGDEGGLNNPSPEAIAWNELPTVTLPANQFTRKLGVDAIELFLRILSFGSLSDEEKESVNHDLKFQSTSLVARLVETADIFNSPRVVRDVLKKSGYAYGKGKIPFNRFTTSLLKLSEDRIRQVVFIAMFLEEHGVVQVCTHALVVMGSRFWRNGVGVPNPEDPRWRYFQGGLEGELYFRRQCVLNTIADLQAFFLRAYGALEDPDEDAKFAAANPTPSLAMPTATTIRKRPYQCRWGFGNSSACDAFHLGQMTRFFALRTKTIFLGSSLIDPDFSLDSENGYANFDDEAGIQDPNDTEAIATDRTGLPTDITALIASLKQCPDYQMDSNHSGCGIRRRLLPALDCIEGFVGDGRGLLGIVLRLRDADSPRTTVPMSSWTDRTLSRAETIDLRFSKILSIRPGSIRSGSQEEDARLFFTARRRNWEA